MSELKSFLTACWALTLLAVAGCSSSKPQVYEHENFDDAGTFSRNYPMADAVTCEAGRRALLSQGYIITSSDPRQLSGHKSFQQTGDTHMEISFNLTCAADGSGKSSTMFANALQDRYTLKKLNNSASLGVGVLGSVSMPIGSTDDSMVKVASETVAAPKFYDRFFALVENFLPPEVKKAQHIDETPKQELGTPEQDAPAQKPAAVTGQAPNKPASTAPVSAEPASLSPAPAPTVEAAPQPTETPQPAASETSQPVAAPVEQNSIEAQPEPAEQAQPAQ